MSDHNIVISNLDLKAKVLNDKARRVFIYNKADIVNIKRDIVNEWQNFTQSNPKIKTVEEKWTSFKHMLHTTMEKCISQRTIKKKWNLPWITPATRRMIRKKQQYYNKARKTQIEEHWKEFRNIRRATKRAIEQSRDNYVLGLLNFNQGAKSYSVSKKFWSYIKSKRNDNTGILSLKNSDGRLISKGKGKAEILSEHFESVFTYENVTNFPELPNSNIPDMPSFDIDACGMEKLLKNINVKKASGPDEISSWILKEAASEIAPFLQFTFMQSIKTSEVPRDWKLANVVAMFKKGNETDAPNYRPVSLTSVTCKILEHIIFHHVMSHLEEHNILTGDQHGFRKGHSRETQLITTIEEFHRNLDKGQQTDAIILDFSKAFDTVPHQRLLSKLEHDGIRGEIKRWISTWLINRNQTVVINGEKSKEAQVRSGVPQRTVLGPLLFLLYIKDIGEGLSSRMRLFADDSLLFGIVKSTNDALQLQTNLDKLNEWADRWQMVFNPSKCYVLSIHRKKSPVIHDYMIKGQALEHVQRHQYLGVTISNDLNWKYHVENIVGKASTTLGFIKRNLKHCPQEVKVQAYKSLVRPILEYSSSVWDPYVNNQIQAIGKVQRRAVRFASNFKELEPGCMSAQMKRLDIPTLQDRRKQARLKLFKKIINNTSAVKVPSYVLRNTASATARQCSNNSQTFIPLLCKTEQYKNSFFSRTIKDWDAYSNNEILEL